MEQRTNEAAPTPLCLDPRSEILRDRVRRFEDEGDPFLRGVIATRIYRDRPELPVVVKRAEILAQTLESIEPAVLPEEHLVGAAYRRRRVHQGVSDSEAWRIQVFHPERHGYREEWPLPDAVRRELRWWADGGAARRAPNPVRERSGWLGKYGIAHPHGTLGGHTLPDHGILLQAGVEALRRRIAARLSRRATDEQRDQLRAMDRCLEGLAGYCRRCARAAQEKAEEVEDPALRVRLEAAAANCAAIAARRPASFHQALQLLLFSNFADLVNNPGDAHSCGRIDRLLSGFYEEDIEGGLLTREQAFDLACHFIIENWSEQSSTNLTLGGVDPEGRDATGELSGMFLEAMEATEMATDITVRLHEDAPGSFVRTVAWVVRKGFGRPSLYNDEVTIEALARQGVDLRDARDYAPLGCVEVMIPGRTAGRTMGLGLNLPKVFELTLNQGCCLVTGEQVWDDVPERFGTFAELLEEYHRRVRQVIDLSVEIIRADEEVEAKVHPRPWLTALSRGGIEAARDITAGQPRYDPVGVTLDGVADIANSLGAVKKLVFEDGKLTLDELRAVLRADWEGHEALRQFVVHRLPRFGQDRAEVDELARQETDFFAACFEDERTFFGGRFWPMVFGVATGLLYGKAPKTGANPSGRRRGEMLAMSFQPSPAGPQGSATELLRSIAAIDFHKFPGGVSNVQEIDPSLVAGEAGLDRLVHLIRGFFDLGGMELSLNFLDETTLRAAQKDPDRHRYLMVRLFGLSAQFVNLSPELQETVIARVASSQRQPAVSGARS